MSLLLEALERHAAEQPVAVALAGAEGTLTYSELPLLVEALARRLGAGSGPLALLLENSPAWAVADLAALRAGRPLLPLPQFFSDAQLAHAVAAAGAREILTDDPERVARALAGRVRSGAGENLSVARRLVHLLPLEVRVPATLPDGTAKITFTSGTTGEPKGVCLGQAHIEQVALALAAAANAGHGDLHLAMLPLATLLENIGGIYAPLLAGARSELHPVAGLGLRGASGLDVGRMLAELQRLRPSSLILVPQLLEAVVAAAAAGCSLPDSLRFVAVGGAPVAPRLLAHAEAVGLPVYEGYGLSESASVVAVNRPDAHRPGSVGRPLPHLRLGFAADGEILIEQSPFLGYLGEEQRADGTYATGDLGHLDEDGYLHLSGRKKNLFITSFGRNVAPEWVERELTAHPAIAQAAVFGEARPFNVAALVPMPGSDRALLEQAVAAANRALPDYARIGNWFLADAPFSPANGQFTANGRPRRGVIAECYGARIEAIYQEDAACSSTTS